MKSMLMNNFKMNGLLISNNINLPTTIHMFICVSQNKYALISDFFKRILLQCSLFTKITINN